MYHFLLFLLINEHQQESIMVKYLRVLFAPFNKITIGHDLEKEAKNSSNELGCPIDIIWVINLSLVWVKFFLDFMNYVHLKIH
jgi:hypothetical protein